MNPRYRARTLKEQRTESGGRDEEDLRAPVLLPSSSASPEQVAPWKPQIGIGFRNANERRVQEGRSKKEFIKGELASIAQPPEVEEGGDRGGGAAADGRGGWGTPFELSSGSPNSYSSSADECE